MVVKMKSDNVTFEEMANDLEKWVKKVNALMVVSTEGKCPQMLKIVILKKMVDKTAEGHKKNNSKVYKRGEKFIDNYIEKFGKLIIKEREK